MEGKTARTFFLAMTAYWGGFGLICTFYPKLMNLFHTADGVAATTDFSAHVWTHCGLDIISVCVLLVTLSRMPPSPTALRGAAIVGLLPATAIGYSVLATSWWSPLFLGAGLGCAAFAVWGFILASKFKARAAA